MGYIPVSYKFSLWDILYMAGSSEMNGPRNAKVKIYVLSEQNQHVLSHLDSDTIIHLQQFSRANREIV